MIAVYRRFISGSKFQNKLIFLFIYIAFPTFLFGQAFEDMTLMNAFNQIGQNRGIAIGDFNNDGLEDIYVSRLQNNNLLYQNLGNFQFKEVSADYNLLDFSSTTCSLWFDMDNDGDLDLFLANLFLPNRLFKNNGDTFEDVSRLYNIETVGNPRSVHAVDYDNDGYLDIYIAQVLEQNILFRNNAGSGFTNVTEEAGIDDTGRSLGAIFFDYDLDGDQDLYQTRDGIDSNLFWINNGDGTFTEASNKLGLDYVGFGMGADVADINNDDYPDIYLTNLEENLMYLSTPSGKYQEVGADIGVDDIGMGWSTFFFDCNNDGLQDLYLANDSYFGVHGQSKIRNRLYVNRGNLNFASQDYTGDVQNDFGSYGAATGDFDLDGRLDMAIANNGNKDGNQLFRNNSNAGNFITFQLKGTKSNYQGIGSRLALYYNGRKESDFVYSGSGYASQNSTKVHFGLGNVDQVDSVVVFWPSGIQQTIKAPTVNQLNEITEQQLFNSNGKVVWTEPAFPTQFDDIKLFFDAKEGNGDLAGFTGDVYAHMGLITSQSNNGNDWKYVIGNWGTADSRVLMTRESNDIYSLSYNIKDFHEIPDGEEVLQLAFVFRNAGGTIVGRNEDGSDIFTPVFPPDAGFLFSITSPKIDEIITLGDSLLISVEINKSVRLEIRDNDQLIFQDTTQNAEFYFQPATSGPHNLLITAFEGDDFRSISRRYFVINNEQVAEDPPIGVRNGLNYSEGSYIFQLEAPGKDYVFFLCPANSFAFDENFLMKKSTDGNLFWIELPRSIFEEGQYTYQYLVDGNITIADPYSKVVLDPSNDPFLDADFLEELPPYPAGTSGIVTAFQPEEQEFDWQNDDFEPAANTDLVIYELLIRDFLADHSYQSLIDTLDYLDRLGINAIELMPIQEFEGNISWGYNPSFHLAVDKYYGSVTELKQFIDEAHARGIAVILDVVFNHAFSQSPLAQLYWDQANFRPAEDNPWLNVIPRHPFNVGYDFNHESILTKNWVKRSLERWIQEFHFDGFRFDLSKGLTQTNSGNDANRMSQYDASRIAILKDYADFIWELDPDSYVIMEHFADNREEIELSEYGMMLWGNVNWQFSQAAEGRRSDLEGADYTIRGWSKPHLISYMESHDEERLMVRVLNSGESAGNYSTRNLRTALKRVEAASTIFYSIPGPKMLWQFGELGYDFSINYCPDGTISDQCRLAERPIRWDYLMNENRERLNQVTSALIHLKTNYPTFATTDFTFSDGNFFLKTVHLNHPDMDAVTLANYRVTNSDINPKFQHPGTWYEYFSGDSIIVEDVNERITFLPGEYRIYTSERITLPEGLVITSIEDEKNIIELTIAPNPIRVGDRINFQLPEPYKLKRLYLSDVKGSKIELEFESSGSEVQLDLPSFLSAGTYILSGYTDGATYITRLIVQ